MFVASPLESRERSAMQQRDHLDRATAALLASLIVRGCSLVWRHHHSGGAVLEDIGGEVVVADLPAVNGVLGKETDPRDREECAPRGIRKRSPAQLGTNVARDDLDATGVMRASHSAPVAGTCRSKD